MIEKVSDILTLLEIKGIGPAKAKQVIDNAKSIHRDDFIFNLKEYYNCTVTKSEWITISNHIKDTLERTVNSGINCLPFYDKNYPKILNNLSDPPLILFVKGEVSSINTSFPFAIVGTRNPSKFTIDKGAEVCEIISARCDCIVSGLALGCDSIAHKSAINFGIPTIAVLPNGLDTIYPKENINLANNILDKGGALLSEYLIGIKPQRHQFVARDRIQAGLSNAGFLLESSKKGGSMHCMRKLKSLNRTIGSLVPPKSQTNDMNWSGNQELLKDHSCISIDTESENNPNSSSINDLFMNKNTIENFNQTTLF